MMTKKVLFALYIIILLCTGGATIIEKYEGTEFVSQYVYGAWWFVSIWALLAVVAIIYFVKSKVKRLSTVTLHLSFIIILIGALITHLFSVHGMMRLRQGETVNTYTIQDKHGNYEDKELPFALRLNSFDIKYHEGTEAASDYESKFTVIDNEKHMEGEVSMNNIFTYKSIRFYQSSYNQMGGSILSINSDPIGIAVTYTGYVLLFIALVRMLFDPKGPYRRLFKSKLIKEGMMIFVLLFGFGTAAVASAPVLPKETAEKFGDLNILYNNRICPMETFALDLTRKLYGSSSYDGLTPEQVLTGWIFWGEEWSNEPILKMKDGPLKETFQLPKYTSVNAFFNHDMGGYIIGPYVQEYYGGNQDKFHKQVADIDNKIQMVMELRRGTLLKIFPYTYHGRTTWYAPTGQIPSHVEKNHKLYMQNVFSLLYEYVQAGDYAKVDDIITKMGRYQRDNGGNSLPSPTQIKAEHIYNAIPFATILFMLNLTMGFILLFVFIANTMRQKTNESKTKNIINAIPLPVMILSFASLTFCEALRWTISGTIPMANGYETMLFVAWLVMLSSIIVCFRFRIILTFGFLMSGFFLLVSHIGQMDPQIGNVMPVLNSPLLSVHVSIIMTGFALLSITFICGAVALVVDASNKKGIGEKLQLLSRLFLYPALTTLGIGIFVGAIWANVSWGRYWSWDPKEVWALITFMVYAIIVHTNTLPGLNRPRNYHLFMLFAFLTVLMTYFGVNYYIGGMHSYA